MTLLQIINRILYLNLRVDPLFVNCNHEGRVEVELQTQNDFIAILKFVSTGPISLRNAICFSNREFLTMAFVDKINKEEK
jgi:hypothetical protein